MTAPKLANAPNTPSLLPGRTAARRLHCTPDYVAKLCREGKLSCVRANNAWFVERGSIAHFRRTRQLLKVARSEELAHLRRQELGLPDQSQAQPQRRPPRSDAGRTRRCRPAVGWDSSARHDRNGRNAYHFPIIFLDRTTFNRPVDHGPYRRNPDATKAIQTR
jgi:hypothetical protein